MNNREVPGDVGRHLVAKIVSSYVKHNTLAVNELEAAISRDRKPAESSSPPIRYSAAVANRSSL